MHLVGPLILFTYLPASLNLVGIKSFQLMFDLIASLCLYKKKLFLLIFAEIKSKNFILFLTKFWTLDFGLMDMF